MGGLSGSQGVKGLAYRVPGGQRVGIQGPRGSRGRLSGSKGVKGEAYRVPGGQCSFTSRVKTEESMNDCIKKYLHFYY